MAKVTRAVKERLISHLERYEIASFFEILDKNGINESLVNSLKQEYLITGVTNIYMQRLMVFVSSMDESNETRKQNASWFRLSREAYVIYSAFISFLLVIFTLNYIIISMVSNTPNDVIKSNKANIDSLYKVIEKQNELINKHIKDNKNNKDSSFNDLESLISLREAKPTSYESPAHEYNYIFFIVGFIFIVLFFYILIMNRKKILELQRNYAKKEDITSNEKEKIVEQTAIKVVDTLNNQPKILKEDEKNNIIEELFSKITSQTAQDIKRKERFETINRTIDYSKTRLENEIKALNRKANFNVRIALAVTSISIFFIIYSIVSVHEKIDELIKFIYYFIPRLSLLVFTQLLANYFLSLYRTNSNEIKYYQNELTDLEYKSISLKIALLSENEENVGYLLKEIMKTERNKVLKDGETTVELEMHKADHTFYKDLNPNKLLEILLQNMQKEEKEKKEGKEDKEGEKT